MNWSEEDNTLEILKQRVREAKETMESVVWEDDYQSQRLKNEMAQDLAKHEKELKEYLHEKEIQQAFEESMKALDEFTRPQEAQVQSGDQTKFKIIKKVIHKDNTGVDLDIDQDIVDAKENDDKIKCEECGNFVWKIDYNKYVNCCEKCICAMYD